MHSVWPILFSILLLLGWLGQPISAAEKRRGGKVSSLRQVRKKQKYNLKPLVYDPKKHRPQVVKHKRRSH